MHRRARHIRRQQRPSIAKPIRRLGLGEVEAEKHDNRRDNETAVQGRAGDVVVLQPPGVPATLDEPVEDGAHDAPAARLFPSDGHMY